MRGAVWQEDWARKAQDRTIPCMQTQAWSSSTPGQSLRMCSVPLMFEPCRCNKHQLNKIAVLSLCSRPPAVFGRGTSTRDPNFCDWRDLCLFSFRQGAPPPPPLDPPPPHTACSKSRRIRVMGTCFRLGQFFLLRLWHRGTAPNTRPRTLWPCVISYHIGCGWRALFEPHSPGVTECKACQR